MVVLILPGEGAAVALSLSLSLSSPLHTDIYMYVIFP
jgi:hypothetical protein